MLENLTRSASGKVFLAGRELGVDGWAWRHGAGMPEDAVTTTALAALTEVAEKRPLQQLVIGVIGPRDATAEQIATADAVGRQLGGLGVTVICGGKSGVMEATCKGVSGAGGLPIGILPGTDPIDANEFVAIPLPTGLNEARNIVIVRAARVLIAIGNSPGTLTEVAYGLHFGKPVIGVAGAAQLDGVYQTDGAEAAVEAALSMLLNGLPVVEAD